ncbi:MAG: DUF3500 domain-containing protein [Pirellulaceae bacterium]|nr:DUF3500 domain-containing protein [Pirellulaceae bacterium]
MKNRRLFYAFTGLLCCSQWGHSFYKTGGVTDGITQAASGFIGALTDEQKSKAVMTVDNPQRVDWHIIPKDTRKGLQLNEMNDIQRQAATALLRSVLSDIGYRKSTQIMNMENLLKELEANKKGGAIRDSTRYYFTIFGTPQTGKKWGLSIEGHHLSLNFLIDGDRVVSSTPQAFAANPAIVRTESKSGIDVGTRMLRLEETVAFELIQSLTESQRKIAVVAETAPRETRTLGVPQPTPDALVGIAFSKLAPPQKKLLKQLVQEYINAVPEEVAEDRRHAIESSGGWDAVHFSWEGSLQPGIGHYYRVQGATFLIEFVNTQPDAAGNIANHVHCIWRDIRGDFGVSL